MEFKKFNRINNIIAVVILFIASFTYLATIEPTASFWDCGEFIASSYKLEVGHPPGNPVFQLIARFFTLFGDKESAAMLVNAMSAMCSAFTIFFLYLTIVHLGRRIIEKGGKILDNANSIAVYGAGVVGSLAYCFSDTFWYSAVEGEVYAMSSLFTAVVFWAMLKWEEQANTPYANRWIVLIAFLMGISIGVHLLNLLTIPALVFIYYFKMYEVTPKRTVGVLALSGIILAVILYGIIPYLPKISAYVDLLFTKMGLPINMGASVFVLALIAAGFWGVYYTYRKVKPLLNIIILCVTLIIVGYSTFAVVVIRSSAGTPTNEYQPDNPFTLVRYIGREQYGSNPLFYGQTFASTYSDIKSSKYYTVLNDEYVKVDSPAEPLYDSRTKMLFPRMWSDADPAYIQFYEMYTDGKGKTVPGGEHKQPTFGANLKYFFNYQIDFMYIRYFMWNFVGRQNDLQASIPGELFKGNWESGIGFIDQARLGDQSEGPEHIVNSKAKNHYYFLPLILGLIGLFYQYRKDKHNWWVTMLLFFLTGIAIVVYLNQPPLQPRERDYAYAGSFYAFTIWLGFAVMWLYDVCKKYLNPKVAAIAAGVVCVIVPFQMASENWDDHDRSNRYTARDMAYNFVQSVDENAILVTHGDNDTFPLWYIQEVEDVRTDVRIMNTSLLGTDWYIDQLKCRMYNSDPVKFSIQRDQYLYGTNDFVQVYDRFGGKAIPGKSLMDIFRNPKITIPLSDGKQHNYIAARNVVIPVNKENVAKYGIVAPEDMHKVRDTIVLSIPENKNSLNKTELMILDLICNYDWERPIYFMQKGGDINIGIKDYMQYDGVAYKFVPIKSKTGYGELQQVGTDALYNRIMNVFRWDSFKRGDYNVDYQNLLTFNNLHSPRDMMVNCAKALYAKGDSLRAVEVLDKMQDVIPASNYPLNNSTLSALTERAIMDAIAIYLATGNKEKAYALADEFIDETSKAILLFASEFHGNYLSYDDLQTNLYYVLMTAKVFESNGDPQKAEEISALIAPFLAEGAQ
ncbi:MAG: DUF2723 domain-containing protein [Bacteroidia bacterium]|nr:DUF2723 domain-containing protein [Bacteroidia bacterium]